MPDDRPKNALVTVKVPGVAVNSMMAKWQFENRTRAVDALTRLNHSEAALFQAQTEVVETTIKKREALFRLQELPERLGHELAVRRMERANSFREAQHSYEVNEARRITELIRAETEHMHAKSELARARTTLTDAEQQLRAQKEHGYFNYELAHKKKSLELLDLELSEAERRALLKQHVRELEVGETLADQDDVVDDALYAKRAELNASGLDCSRLDAAIEVRKAKRRE